MMGSQQGSQPESVCQKSPATGWPLNKVRGMSQNRAESNKSMTKQDLTMPLMSRAQIFSTARRVAHLKVLCIWRRSSQKRTKGLEET